VEKAFIAKIFTEKHTSALIKKFSDVRLAQVTESHLVFESA